MSKSVLVCGAGGFIGNHLVKRLKEENYFVVGVDIKPPEFSNTCADDFIKCDLRSQKNCIDIFSKYPHFDELYQLAADMGGAGYIFSGDNDANLMNNSVQININIASLFRCYDKVFYSSSACVYPEFNQVDKDNPTTSEHSAYPANPDSEYGWEKLFSERLYRAYARNHGVNVRIARFHNIYGTEGSWNNGKEKAPAAIARKVSEVCNGINDTVEIWGNGEQTRSFLYIDECLEGIRRLVCSECSEPLNIGSNEMISINGLAKMTMDIANMECDIVHVDGPLGVNGRTSDNNLILKTLSWEPSYPLHRGMTLTYDWINGEVIKNKI